MEPGALTILPGEAATVRLKLDLAHRKWDEIGQAYRNLTVTVEPVLRRSPSKSPTWRLHGTVRSRVTLDTLALQFGEEPVRGQAPFTRKVTATVHVPAAQLRPQASPPLVTIEVSRHEGSPDQFDLAMAPVATLQPGPFQSRVQVDLLTADGECLPGPTLPVSGTVQPEVRALPARLFLGARAVGGTADATVTLQVPPGEEWAADHIEVQSPDVQVDRTDAPGIPAGRAFRVRQRIAKEGHQSSTVRFFLRKAGGEPVPLSMEVTYDGAAVDPDPGAKHTEVQP